MLVAAGGFGTRMQSEIPKQFLLLAGTPVIVHTINAFSNAWKNPEFIVVLPEEEMARWEKIRKKFLKKASIHIIKGGATRFHSVKNGLKMIKENGIVAVQDACRPFVTEKLLTRCLATAMDKGNAIPAIDLQDSIREIMKDGSRYLNRNRYKVIQTPQCFKVEVLKNSYRQTFSEEFTDDASVAEAAGVKINLVDGDQINFKITTKHDLVIAERLIGNSFGNMSN